MPLPAPPQDEAGGWLRMVYEEPAYGERHQFKCHIAHFDLSSFAYTGVGPVVPSEPDVGTTFAAFGALWAAYYPVGWTLSIDQVWYNAGGEETVLPTIPLHAPIHGSYTGPLPTNPVVTRRFSVTSVRGRQRRLWFQQLPGQTIGDLLPVSGASGGLDSRDRDLMAYLAGTATGLVAPDGFRFAATAELRTWWARDLVALESVVSGSGVDALGHVGTACLTFPRFAQICNPSDDVVILATPTGEYRFTPMVLFVPGGHSIGESFG